MTKNLPNKIHLKEQLYTFSMAKGTPIEKYLDDFNSIIINLESLEVKIKDEDKVIPLAVSSLPSYKHFKEIVLYNNNDTLSFENVKANLLSKEKFDLKVRSDDKAEGSSIRERSFEKEGMGRRNFRLKSKRCKFNKFCKYCRKPRYLVAECSKLKNKKEKGNNYSTEVAIADSGLDGDVLLVTTTDNRDTTEWVLDSGCTYHMCFHRGWFSTYEPLDLGAVFMDNDA